MSYRLSMVILVLMSAAGTVADCQAQSGEAVDGKILEVTCRRARLTRKGRLRSKISPQDAPIGLKAGDMVECLAPDTGHLMILVPGKEKEVEVTANNPYTVPTPPVSELPYPLIAQYLTGYGLAGATRGTKNSSLILWPAESGVVVPNRFVIRWMPMAQRISLSVMSEGKDVTVWGPVELDGAAGSLKSDELSSALVAYKAKSASPRMVVTLSLVGSADWEEVHFSLLEGRDEEELNAQLTFWAQHTTGLALQLGRAYSFLRHKLFVEAADEYDSALNSSPDSRSLLEEAIRANQLAGRTLRVTELKERLSSNP